MTIIDPDDVGVTAPPDDPDAWRAFVGRDATATFCALCGGCGALGDGPCPACSIDLGDPGA